jgi:conjugal transfer/entry exclusion protein
VKAPKIRTEMQIRGIQSQVQSSINLGRNREGLISLDAKTAQGVIECLEQLRATLSSPSLNRSMEH